MALHSWRVMTCATLMFAPAGCAGSPTAAFDSVSQPAQQITASTVAPAVGFNSSPEPAPQPSSSEPAGETSSSEPAPASYAGPITSDSVQPGTGIELSVPTAEPIISWQQAYETCRSGTAECGATAATVIQLAAVTDRHSGSVDDAGTLTPLMNETLAFVLTQQHVACAQAGGPPAPPGGSPEPRPADQCTIVTYVDARSGDVLYSTGSLEE